MCRGEAGRAAPRLLSITKTSYKSRQLGSDLPLVAVESGGSGRLGKTPPPAPLEAQEAKGGGAKVLLSDITPTDSPVSCSDVPHSSVSLNIS